MSEEEAVSRPPYAEIATARARRFDGWRDIIENLPAHGTQFELAGAVAADVAADPMSNRDAYDRRILLVTLDSAIAEIERLRAALEGAPHDPE